MKIIEALRARLGSSTREPAPPAAEVPPPPKAAAPPAVRKTTAEALSAVPDLAQQTYGFGPWKHVIPLPPLLLMHSTGAPSLENFLLVGESWAQVVSRSLPERAAVLDIGCGCGKTARMLARHPHIASYVGFDVLKPSIDWCQHSITPMTDGRFQFRHCDVLSLEYNPTGSLRACDATFPAADASIDVAFAASLFTHLLEDDARSYLLETRRVLKPGGKAIFSIHVDHRPGTKYMGGEARIDVDPKYFLELAASADLELEEDLGELCGQIALIFRSRRS